MLDQPQHCVRRRIDFDALTWQALNHLSFDTSKSVQELADEAFRDLLKKYRRPLTLKDMLQESIHMLPANDRGGNLGDEELGKHGHDRQRQDRGKTQQAFESVR